jgi:alkylation response protein AidB-like acyl-CoA dehydrogenase
MPHLIETKQALSNPEDDMPRNLYGADHEAFRKTARELVERSLKPRDEQFIEARVIDREAWTEAGKQGLLGLEVPEVYGGSDAGDYRFNAVLGEELSKFNAAASSCFGIHADCVRFPLRLRYPRSISVIGGTGLTAHTF